MYINLRILLTLKVSEQNSGSKI